MATEVGATVPDDMAGGAQPKAAILLVVGEPFSEDDKTLILAEITKGFRAWDCEATGININDELAQIANRAALGDEGPNGERVIRHRSDNVAVEILINPQAASVKKALRGVLTQLSQVKAVIFAGYAIQGTASWVVQDDTYSFGNFTQLFKDPDVENAIKQVEGSSLMIHTVGPNDWTSALKGSDAARLLKVAVNPGDKLDNMHGVLQFAAYVSSFVKPVPLPSILQSSDVIGNISFTRPVLYIFPASQGDSALFGMKGFNMLINGGYSRRACFWDFARHLDGIDALLLTHLGSDNLFGVKSVLQRKNADSIHPEIGYMFMNHGKQAVTNGDTGDVKNGEPSLLINLAMEGNKLLELSKHISHVPHPLSRTVSGNLEPINLFHKVGMGSLDMYVLNPVGDGKEMKDFLQQWGKQASNFGSSNGIPIPNCTSISALLVVRPASANENITRILFPGNAPQHKLLEGLERVKNLEFLKHPTFCTHDLHKPKKAPGVGNGRAGSANRKQAPVPKATAAPVKAEPPKRLETKMAAPKATSTPAASAKATKLKKEDNNNKRLSSVHSKEKVKLDEKEKEDKSKSSKSSTSSSPSKASVKTASPIKTPSSPVKTPATSTPEDMPPPAAVPEPAVSAEPPQNHVDEVPADGLPANFLAQDPIVPMTVDDNRVADSPEALPEPTQFGSDVDSLPQHAMEAPMTDKQRLQEMGIYDDDDDDEAENGFDDKENSFLQRGGSQDAEDELVQPQSLPEPVAAVTTPPSAGPDLIQDTFNKFSGQEELLQAESSQDLQTVQPTKEPEMEAEVKEPEMEAEVQEPEMEAEVQEPEMEAEVQEPEMEAEVQEPEMEAEVQEPEMEAEVQEPEMEAEVQEPEIEAEAQQSVETGYEPEPAMSRLEPDDAEPDFTSHSGANDTKDLAAGVPPFPETKSEEQPDFGFTDQMKEQPPMFEEPSFAEEPQETADSAAVEQNIQYGIANDNGFQMGGIREEEEEEVAGDAEEQQEEGQGDGQPVGKPELDKFAKEELGIYDDEDQEEDEEKDGGDGGDDDKEAYVYEKDVNLEDEEVHRGGPVEQQYDQDPEEQQYDQGREDEQYDQSREDEQYDQDREEEHYDQGCEEQQYDQGREEEQYDQGPEQRYDQGLDQQRYDQGHEQQYDQEAEEQRYDQGLDQQQYDPSHEEQYDHGAEERQYDQGQEEDEAQGFDNEEGAQDDTDNQVSNIPEAFEKDETPTPVENNSSADKQSEELVTFEQADQPGTGEADSGREDTDSIDGGTPDDDKDIDEVLAMQQHQMQADLMTQQQEEELVDHRMEAHGDGPSGSQGFNPFVGLDGQMAAAMYPSDPFQSNAFEADEMESTFPRGGQGPDDFDPLAQWGQPTGLPSPAPPQDHQDAEEEEESRLPGLDRVQQQMQHSFPLKEEEEEEEIRDFDPAAEWGHPMGLPSPPPPDADTKATSKNASGDAKKADSKKTSPTKSKASEKRPPSASKGPAKSANGSAESPRSARQPTDKKAPTKANLDTSRAARPSTAPARTGLDTSKVESKPRANLNTTTSRRPATASSNSRASPVVTKMPPLPPMTPFYVDLTYIPAHGNTAYSDIEFFKRVRARYYVLSALSPNPTILQALMEAKATWDKGGEQEVTIIPTYETDVLRHWMALHKDQLAQLKIDVAPAASCCTVRLQDHEDSCFTYRLEF